MRTLIPGQIKCLPGAESYFLSAGPARRWRDQNAAPPPVMMYASKDGLTGLTPEPHCSSEEVRGLIR